MSDFSFKCPYCSTELQPPLDAWSYSCDHCGQRLDLKAQYAFLRGLEAFDEGQGLMFKEGPRKSRNKTRDNAVYKRVLDLFVEAYSALQVAFLGKLEEVQRQVGVEMMASMSAEFFLQNMISPLETSYWSSILTEQRAQTEIDGLKEKLSHSNESFQWLKHARRKLRIAQLKKKLPELDQKIKRIEAQIAFVDVPRARNKNWKP